MSTMRIERTVHAPAPRVWEVITDIEGSARVLSGVDRIERLDDGPFGVGTRWRETRTLFGRQATEELEVTAVDPGRSYTVEATSRGTRYVSEMGVIPGDDTSTLYLTFGGQPSGTVAKLLAATVGRLFQGSTRKALARDLDDIAAAAEARADTPGGDAGRGTSGV